MAHQMARERHAVLDRDAGARRERRHHRMRSVAQERDAATSPTRQRIAVADAPFEALLGLAQHFEQRRVPAAVAGEQLLDARRHHPAFVDPFLGDTAGENVVERAAADRIADHVALRADPADVFVADDLDRTAGADARRHVFDRHDAAPGHLLREARGESLPVVLVGHHLLLPITEELNRGPWDRLAGGRVGDVVVSLTLELLLEEVA